MGDEAEALYDQEEFFEERIQREDMYFQRIAEMESRYNHNAKKALQSIIHCACCGREIIKKNYQSQFCRNKGANNCKDRYWNNVSEGRRKRAQSIVKYH